MNRLVHDLTIQRVTYDEGTDDTYGQPTAHTTTTAVKGLVQPKSAREMEDSRSAGAQVSDHVIFLSLDADLDGSDEIRHGQLRYQPTGIRRFDFGSLQHLEVDARRVASSTEEADGS